MAQEIFCPNCGGLIFSSDPDALQMQQCTCAQQTPSRSAASKSAAVATAAAPTETAEARVSSVDAPKAPLEEKICIKCGKDVNGHRRLKDDDGNYWCYACAKEDDRKKRQATQPARSKCALCSEEVSVTNLLAVDGRFLCPKCVREQRELAKKTEARIGRISQAYEGQDWKRLGPMLGVLGLCALIIILRMLGIIGGS
jgi:DNA-directed RNA polymerase subunit M/transcription elongation factor TFIIS